MWEARGCCVHIGDQWAGGRAALGRKLATPFVGERTWVAGGVSGGVFALPLVPGQRRARVAREVAGPWLSICVSVFLRNGL